MEPKIEQSLIQQARQGDQDAMGRLAQAVKPRVCAYLYRVALNYDLAEDLTQEALLEMVKSINNLREPEHFWGWLYRIASNKFLNYCRQKKMQQTAEQTLVDNFADRIKAQQKEHGVSHLLRTELSRAVLAAIGRLEPQERSVLSLRCYDQLAYMDIAEALNTSEMNARVLFFRAKQALKKELVRQGLSKTSLLMALGFFGYLTESAEAGTVAAAASMTVPASAVHVPVTITILATCGLKGLFVAAGILLVSSVLILSTGNHDGALENQPVLPQRQEVRSYHFTAQSRNSTPGAPSSLSKGAYEQWYYHPDDVDGPVFMRMQRWSTNLKEKQCTWLQNGQGNYYYESSASTVYIRNYRLWGRTLARILVKRLPTDEPEFCDFLDQIEGNTKGLVQQRDSRTGLLVQAVDNRFVNSPYFKTTYGYNEIEADFFNYNWPAGISTIDERDPMRKRGWTWFQIEGTIDDESLNGYGQIPFFYDASKEHPAWLVFDVGGKIKIVDTKDFAIVLDSTGKEIARYAGHRFFEGLLRPWMGMHTIDTIRRDAAQQKISFETIQLSDYSKSGSEEAYYADAKVICNDKTDLQAVTITYLVAMKEDIIKSVEVKVYNAQGRTHVMNLEFTYLQDISKLPAEFKEPQTMPATLPVQPDNGTRWLIDLANQTLGAQ
jgi:RNA polymerase sigma-70 factor, ECF subfamily